MRYATSAGRAILTNNAWDFNRLHASDPNHAGGVTFSDDDDETAFAGRLIKVTRPNVP